MDNIEQLLEDHTLFRGIFMASPSGIKLLNLNGVIKHANPAMLDILGYSEEQLVGKHFTQITHLSDRLASEGVFNDLVGSLFVKNKTQKRYLHNDGSLVWAEVTFAALKNKEGQPLFIVGVVEDITEQKEIEAELVELKNHLADRLETERLLLAQELHDGPIQDLHSMAYQIEGLKNTLGENSAGQLDDIAITNQKVIDELRIITTEMRPPALAEFGLEKAIRSHASSFQVKHPGLEIQLTLAQDNHSLPDRVRLALFRIYQQALVNVIRHAHATQVQVSFEFDDEKAELSIQDNGKGFTVPTRWIALVRNGHYGLAGAFERVNALNGQFDVTSRPQGGTSIRAVIPNHGA